MKTWDLYPAISAPMSFQMALDEILFRSALQRSGARTVAPCLRFYFSSEPWVTIGYSQKKTDAGIRLPFCRRMTGGGTVFHGKDLVFSIVAAKWHDPSFQSVSTSYMKIHEAVKCGLEQLGKRPRFFRCTENLTKGEDCFRFPIVSDLAVGERKVAGGAQKRSCGIFLHQESIQLGDLDFGTVITGLQKGFCRVFDIDFVGSDLLPEFVFEAEELRRLKYEAKNDQDLAGISADFEHQEVLSSVGGLS